nr:DUF1007 family protein [Acuticoccus mangrovi]
MLLASAGTVSAHPDIAMRCRILLNFKNDKIDYIAETWTFDSFFSQGLLNDFDKDRDGAFDAAEAQALQADMMARLAEERYFTYFWAAGEEIANFRLIGFEPQVRDGYVTVGFALSLPHPVEPGSVKVELKDPSGAVSIELVEEQPVILRGMRAGWCEPQLYDSSAEAFFEGLSSPASVAISCGPR